MKAIDLIKNSKKGFSIEDEVHLSFVLGYSIDKNEFLKKKTKKYRNLITTTFAFLVRIFSLVSFNETNNLEKTRFFIYAGSINQLRSLESTIDAMKNNKTDYHCFLGESLLSHPIEKTKRSENISFRITDILVTLALFVTRAPALFLNLLKTKNFTGINKYFNSFCMAYLYLPRFLFLLSKKTPSYIIVSNDHNASNRSLMLAASLLHIKTVFLQHGSGSTLLPPLEFDYAFLDGLNSVEKYVNCNQAIGQTRNSYSTSDTTIFLSGVKKKISKTNPKGHQFAIGVAINPFDNIYDVCCLVENLVSKNLCVIIRAHPAQEEKDLEVIACLSKSNKNLTVSEFKNKSTAEFLSQVSFLIAGKSGIHTEAALSGTPTYYFEFGKSKMTRDLYGHLQGGIVMELPYNFQQLSKNEIKSFAKVDRSTKNNIKRFSESFDTKWEGKEGDLVLKTLTHLEEKELDNIYYPASDSLCYQQIYHIR